MFMATVEDVFDTVGSMIHKVVDLLQLQHFIGHTLSNGTEMNLNKELRLNKILLLRLIENKYACYQSFHLTVLCHKSYTILFNLKWESAVANIFG